MNVYVITKTNLCVDTGDFQSSVIGVYEIFEQAQSKLKELIKETRREFQDYDTEVEETDYIDGDMTWSIWETEEELSHQCDIQIVEKEVL